MLSIVLIAPPAAGKGTQANLLSVEYNIPHISTGDILREASHEETERGSYIKREMELGNLVDNNLIFELLEERLKEKDCKNGYILDGFPRNVEQAEQYDLLLEKMNNKLDYVFLLDVDKDIAKKRILGRLNCRKCGKVYNEFIKEAMPKEVNHCDVCNSILTKRNDDNVETFEERFKTYIEKTKPLIDYYTTKHILYHVNSGISKENTFEQIKNTIGSLL